MKKGDLVCSKDKSVVGVVTDFVSTFHSVTIAVLWNEPPTAQGCKTFTLHNDNVILLPKGTIIRELCENGKYLECEYESYNHKNGIIYGKNSHNLSILGCEEYEFIFKDDEDVTTDVWDLIFDITKDKKGFEKLYCELVLYHVLKYCEDKDVNRLKKIEKALEELYDEVKKTEI